MASSKTTTPASTTVKVSAQTGAAKDDLFAGISEDSSSQILNVLANDPGSANLWSIDQNALNAPAGSQQPQALAPVTLASGGKLYVNVDGTLRYEGAAALQSLAEGEIFNDSFIYTIRMANGALSTAKANVQIVGKNDVAIFSGDKSGALTEDQSSVSGKLNVSDVDHDQSAMQAAALTGTNGNLRIDIAGNWSYGLTRDMNYLAAGESVSEKFTVKSVDGTEQVLTMTINGVNDVATFSGDKNGTLTEDQSGVSGKLNVSDLDHDQSAMQAAALTGTNGNLRIDITGNWSYGLTRDMNYLPAGQSASESFTVKSVDGTEQVLTLTVTGVNDAATFGGTATGSVQEDGVLTANGVLTVQDVDLGQSGFGGTGNLSGTYGNFTFDLQSGAWTYALRNADANVQALATGQSVQDSLQISAIDGTTSNILINIGGTDEPVVVTNPAVKWNVNKINVTKSGGGLDSQVAYDGNGVARIVGFDSNDTLHPIGAMNNDTPFLQLIDTDGVNGVDSTQLNFNYSAGGGPNGGIVHVDVILVGYTSFTDAQLQQPSA